MIRKVELILGIIGVLLLTACAEHLVKDKGRRAEIHAAFEQRRDALLMNRQQQLLNVFDADLTQQEREGIEFLYAYETLSDLSNYDSDHYLQQVRYAIKAMETFSWGKTVSNEDFLHFVLAPRAGTENMDSARVVIFHELKDRILNMDMKEAALEVNHWCHEKVTYTGSDGRTSAPLATIKNAKGRCGEESVLTVTALRAVGIPARQIYTPRWVHQDDNHAWVEFWADGKWYFMGACEPEADVNQGWFVEPTRRAILTNTITPGHYAASDVIDQSKYFTRLNQTSNYTTAKDVYVRIVDHVNNAIEDAEVSFLVCNYAELFNLVSLKTNAEGICKLKLGLGDLLVWSRKEDMFNFKKISVADVDTVQITLEGNNFSERIMDMDLVPPVKKVPLQVSEEGKKENKVRLAYEDSIRHAYERTFMSKKEAMDLASKLGLDTTQVWQTIKKSRGNWRDIQEFMEKVPIERKTWILPLLQNVSEKDLRDASAGILLSHMLHSPEFDGQCTEDEYARYILNPRVEREKLSAYKAFLQKQFRQDFWGAVLENPLMAEDWILQNINITKDENYIPVASVPQGVFEMKTCDPGSARLFFVALCRTAGVRARIHKVTGLAQYKTNEAWVNVFLGEKMTGDKGGGGSIHLLARGIDNRDCRYFKQFTLSRFINGRYETLDFEFNKKLSDFPDTLTLETGNYLLYTAERQNDGTLLTRMSFFPLRNDEHKTVVVSLRQDEQPLESLGSFYLPDGWLQPDGTKLFMNENSFKNGVVLACLDPDKEPTKHVLKEFEGLIQSYDALNVPFIFVLPNDERAKLFKRDEHKLPENSSIAMDDGMLNELESALGRELKNHLPVLALVSANNEIVYLSSGYKIGTGDQLLKVLKKYHENK